MLSKLSRKVSKLLSLARKELRVLETLHEDVKAAVRRLEAEDPGLNRALNEAYAYAVFPSVGKAAAVVGGAFGKGEVFERGGLVGYAAVVQSTVGVQLGGDTFSEVIAFEDKPALDRFRAGKFTFAANASAVAVKAGAAASADYGRGAAVFVHSEGGLMLEAAVGGQKFIFRPAGLGRFKRAPHTRTEE